jgi:hypothetical protein
MADNIQTDYDIQIYKSFNKMMPQYYNLDEDTTMQKEIPIQLLRDSSMYHLNSMDDKYFMENFINNNCNKTILFIVLFIILLIIFYIFFHYRSRK